MAEGGRPIRAFIAVPLPEALHKRLGELQRELRPHFPGVRWVKPESSHLTLCFLGEVAEEVLENITKVMLSVASSRPPFAARATGVGAFPGVTRPRVLWVGLDGGAALLDLQQTLAREVAGLGLSLEERAFHPHLTLGRCHDRTPPARDLLAPYRDLDCGQFSIERIVLYESRLDPSGAQHLPRAVVPLGGRGDGPGDTHI